MGLVVSKTTFNKKVVPCTGTGFLIGPNVVLTCGHNVYQSNKRKDHEEIYFIPGPLVQEFKSTENPEKYFSVKKVIIPDQYRKINRFIPDEVNPGLLFDIAVLILDPHLNLEEYFGSFSYSFDWEKSRFVKNIEIMKDLELIGFPQKD